MKAKIIELIISLILSLGIVCLGVWLFSIQFEFEWSFILCLCVWLMVATLKWIFGKD